MPDSSTQIVSHRGGGGYVPENTIAGIERTIYRGVAQWVDFDVQRSADGVPVVVHDLALRRTSDVADIFPDRVDRPVGEFTLGELRQLDVGSWFGAGDFIDERIPTLDEALDQASGRVGISFQLKHPSLYPGIEAEIGEILRRHGLTHPDEVQAGSFEHDSLLRLRAAVPGIAIVPAFRRA